MKKYHATILVVEDNSSDQLILHEAFKANGVTAPVHTVSSGEEAIAYMKGEGKFSDRQKFSYPTFVLTDLKMPNGDGFTVLEFLKSNPEWKIIPTVVLTASADPDDIKKSYMLGASSYHVKPVDFGKCCKFLEALHAYWMLCEVPEVDSAGKLIITDAVGKLGERIPQPESTTGEHPT